MTPRAFAVSTAIASAAWLAPFLTGCSASASLRSTQGTSTATAKLDAGGPEARVVHQAATPDQPVRLIYVTHGRRDASDFKRVAEYFTGKPENGTDIVVATDPSVRTGYWFTFALGSFDTLPKGARVTLETVSSANPAPRTTVFDLPPVTAAVPSREFHLGFTGKQALASGEKITAWRLTLRDAKGGEPVSSKSYLWELPPAVK